MTENELRQDVVRWFHSKDAAALERVFAFLVSELRLPATFKAMFQSVDAEDLIVEVVEDLLRRDNARFREAPLAYARSTLRNRAVDRLRKKGQRGAPQFRDDLDEHAHESAPMPDDEDARRVLELVAALPLKGRLALLLTTAPDRISAADWQAVAQAHPPPPPTRPGAACESDEASRLLYPPPAEETRAQREQRLDTFSKARRRAIEEIRARFRQGQA